MQIGFDQALGDGRSLDALAIDAAAIIRNFDHHASRAMHGRKPDVAGLGLACGQPDLGLLDAMIDGIADHVRERIGQALDHGLVDFGGLAITVQGDGFSGHVGGFTHDA